MCQQPTLNENNAIALPSELIVDIVIRHRAVLHRVLHRARRLRAEAWIDRVKMG